MNELLAIYAFIRAQLLGGDAPDANQQALRALVDARVFAGVAPTKDAATGKTPAYPFVVLATVAANNVIVQDGTTAWVNALIDVKIVGSGSLSDLAPVDALVFTLLQKQSGVVDDAVNVMACHQEAVLIAPPVVDGDAIFNQIVQSYRVRAHRLPQALAS